MIRSALLLVAAFALRAQTPEALLERAKVRLLETIDHLPRYTCTQTIDRSYFRAALTASTVSSCDAVIAARRPAALTLSRTDRLRLDVMVGEEGNEVYSWPGDRALGMERLEALAGDGPIGTGAFGPFLINIFASPGVEFISDGSRPLDARPAMGYRFRVPLPASHYRVIIGGVTRIVPYDGRFWLDPESAELLRLTVRTSELAPATGNCEADNTVDFARVAIGGGIYLLPGRNVLRIVRRDTSETENLTTYATCHEFRGESIIHFEGDAEAVSAAPGAAAQTLAAFPAGLSVSLALAAPIDTATAAAGDLVFATLAQAVTNRKRNLAAPAGTRVRGRITAMQHTLGDSPGFAVTIAWDALESNRQWIPFAARMDQPVTVLEPIRLAPSRDGATVTQSRRAPPRGDTLAFHSTAPAHTVPAGHTSRWITIAPTGAPPAAR